MLKERTDKYYFDQNYNCAESVLRAANEYYGLDLHDRDMILIGACGAGMQTGHTCGAILAACAVLSMRYVPAKAHESADIKPVTTLFLDKITAAMGSFECSVIKPKYFVEGRRCKATVDLVCDLLEETIAEYDAKK